MIYVPCRRTIYTRFSHCPCPIGDLRGDVKFRDPRRPELTEIRREFTARDFRARNSYKLLVASRRRHGPISRIPGFLFNIFLFKTDIFRDQNVSEIRKNAYRKRRT